jgi:hypothetical protein
MLQYPHLKRSGDLLLSLHSRGFEQLIIYNNVAVAVVHAAVASQL